MFLEVYNKVKEIIGVLPQEFEFIYILCTIFLFVVIVFVVISPFILLYKISK